MALQVWLPLTGNLKNQGLSDVEIPNVTLLYDTTGKIGKAFTLKTSPQLYFIEPSLVDAQIFSFAFWYKPISDSSITANWRNLFQLEDINTEGTAGTLRVQSSYGSVSSQYVISIHNNTSYGIASVGYVFTNEWDKWHHIAFTCDGNECKGYLNGTLVKTDTFNGGKLSGKIWVGAGSGGANGLMNDLRIYDHALSPKEVKELSKGLVAHYPLNDGVGGKNLLSVIPRNYTATAYNAYQFSLSENLVAGQTYTIQFWDVDVFHASKSEADLGIDVYWGGGSVRLVWWHGTSYFTNGHADYLKATFTVTEANASGNGATNAWLNIYNSVFYVAADMNLAIGKWKLEKGSVATPWIPNPNDELYSTMGFDDGIVYDCSGYGHNATVVGNLEVSTNSPRYSVATYFNGSSYARTLPGEMAWSNFETLTITAWIKPTVAKSGYSGSIGITHDANADRKCFAISNYGGKFTVNTVNGTTYINTYPNYTMPLNEWHHYAAILNNGQVKMYVDGEFVHTATIDYGTATLHPNPQINIAVDLPGSNETYIGDYSDVRIYATALSPEDIKELYETSASIDDHGNFYAYEIQEV